MNQMKCSPAFYELAGVEMIDGYFASQFALPADHAQQPRWFMLLVALSVLQRQGHTCLQPALLAGTTWFADTEQQLPGFQFDSADSLADTIGQAIAHCAHHQALFWDGQRLYTRRYWQFEQDIAKGIARRQQAEVLSDSQYAALNALWPALFDTKPASQPDWQQLATASALQQRFCIINGGPGTGKTYTVTRLLLALQCAHQQQLTIQLAAPTGKAAQRMNESVAATLQSLRGTVSDSLLDAVPTDAITLHRLLKISRLGIQAKMNAQQPLHCDVLIVDEASMIDMALMARLLRALPAHASLILVGDADQLPAVESGNVLEALMSGASPGQVSPALARHLETLCPHLPALPQSDEARDDIQTLQVSRRFGGDLGKVAQAIQAGDAAAAQSHMYTLQPLLASTVTQLQGVAQLAVEPFNDDLSALARWCFGPVRSAGSAAEALACLQHWRWLTPVRQGPLGVVQLNRAIEQALGITVTPGRHYRGRPVMVVQNNYAQQLFNGDVGIIWPDENQHLKAWFETPQGLKKVSLSRLPAVETVFAMTVHKSQGSEFARVILPLPEPSSSQMAQLCTRELLYTGLTRAKQGCLVVSGSRRFEQVVATRQQRHSGLAAQLSAQQDALGC